MDLPASLLGSAAEEGDIYFFTPECPVGIVGHMHVCIKHAEKVILLSTCSSQIDTAIRIARLRDYDMKTFPMLKQSATNNFSKPLTYVNCNKVVELSDDEFGQLLYDGKIYKLQGKLEAHELAWISEGIKLSPDIEGRIKKMFG